MGRYLFFTVNAYPGLQALSFFALALLSFSYVGALLFPFNPDFHQGMPQYLAENYGVLLTIPFLFSVISTHTLCMFFLRKSAVHYFWEGDTFYLLQNGQQTSIQRQSIQSVSSLPHFYPGHPWRTLKLFKVKTLSGTFYFDEAHEKAYSQEPPPTSFWSIKGGRKRRQRNVDFLDGTARASYFFEDPKPRSTRAK